MAKPPKYYLIVSIIIDLIGIISFFVPFLGEISDAVWAPVSAALINVMYGSLPLAIFGFFEEALPGTDFIPTATLAWIYYYFIYNEEKKKKKQ